MEFVVLGSSHLPWQEQRLKGCFGSRDILARIQPEIEVEMAPEIRLIMPSDDRTIDAFTTERERHPISMRQSRVTVSVHEDRGGWSRFTRILREYLVPWLWKRVYLFNQQGESHSVLMRTDEENQISLVVTPRLFDAYLAALPIYEGSSRWHEYLMVPSEQAHTYTYWDFLFGLDAVRPKTWSRHERIPIYRARSWWSFLVYQIKKHSPQWTEITMRINEVATPILIPSQEIVRLQGAMRGMGKSGSLRWQCAIEETDYRVQMRWEAAQN